MEFILVYGIYKLGKFNSPFPVNNWGMRRSRAPQLFTFESQRESRRDSLFAVEL